MAGCTHEDVSRPLAIESSPIGFSRTDRTATSEGRLRFLGGIRLTSSDPDFGGLSALLVSTDGSRFVAVSDQAHWVTGRLRYDDGRLIGVEGDRIAPMLGLDGQPLSYKSGDAEALASTSGNDIDGDLLVGFEGRHRIWRYPFARDGVAARPSKVPVPEELHGAPRNGGLEGITLLAGDVFFCVSERYRDGRGDYRAWFLTLPAPEPEDTVLIARGARAAAVRHVSIRAILPFAITDVRRLPAGDMLTLERRYSAVKGVGSQLRILPRAAVEKAARSGSLVPLDGRVIASFDADFEIDNMEGLALRQTEDGRTLVYLLSDDNFHRRMQSTLLILYELMP